VAQHLIKIT